MIAAMQAVYGIYGILRRPVKQNFIGRRESRLFVLPRLHEPESSPVMFRDNVVEIKINRAQALAKGGGYHRPNRLSQTKPRDQALGTSVRSAPRLPERLDGG